MSRKTAHDFPLTMSTFGINLDDDDQVDAINEALRNTSTYRLTRGFEGYLVQGFILDNMTTSKHNLAKRFGAALQAKGIRPEELRT